eukprot:jgi/Mesvir1/7888/Mv11821-RA.1
MFSKWKQRKGGKDGLNATMIGRTLEIGQFHVQVREAIAQGGFSFVYLVREMSGRPFALKQTICQNDDEENEKIAVQELRVMEKLSSHPNIVRMVAHSIVETGGGPGRSGSTEYLMLLEYCDTSLVDVMNQEPARRFPEPQVVSIFHAVCSAVDHMHAQSPPITHRDIKAENVLRGAVDGVWKLCDFGSCVTRAKRYTTPDEIGMEEDVIRRTTTPAYRAPEMWDLYRKDLVDTKVDIWALGCLLFRLLFFESAFSGESKLQVLNGDYRIPPGAQNAYSEPLLGLLRSLLRSKPEERPNIRQVLHVLRGLLPADPSTPSPHSQPNSARGGPLPGGAAIDNRSSHHGHAGLPPESPLPRGPESASASNVPVADRDRERDRDRPRSASARREEGGGVGMDARAGHRSRSGSFGEELAMQGLAGLEVGPQGEPYGPGGDDAASNGSGGSAGGRSASAGGSHGGGRAILHALGKGGVGLFKKRFGAVKLDESSAGEDWEEAEETSSPLAAGIPWTSTAGGGGDGPREVPSQATREQLSPSSGLAPKSPPRSPRPQPPPSQPLYPPAPSIPGQGLAHVRLHDTPSSSAASRAGGAGSAGGVEQPAAPSYPSSPSMLISPSALVAAAGSRRSMSSQSSTSQDGAASRGGSSHRQAHEELLQLQVPVVAAPTLVPSSAATVTQPAPTSAPSQPEAARLPPGNAGGMPASASRGPVPINPPMPDATPRPPHIHTGHAASPASSTSSAPNASNAQVPPPSGSTHNSSISHMPLEQQVSELRLRLGEALSTVDLRDREIRQLEEQARSFKWEIQTLRSQLAAATGSHGHHGDHRGVPSGSSNLMDTGSSGAGGGGSVHGGPEPSGSAPLWPGVALMRTSSGPPTSPHPRSDAPASRLAWTDEVAGSLSARSTGRMAEEPSWMAALAPGVASPEQAQNGQQPQRPPPPQQQPRQQQQQQQDAPWAPLAGLVVKPPAECMASAAAAPLQPLAQAQLQAQAQAQAQVQAQGRDPRLAAGSFGEQRGGGGGVGAGGSGPRVPAIGDSASAATASGQRGSRESQVAADAGRGRQVTPPRPAQPRGSATPPSPNTPDELDDSSSESSNEAAGGGGNDLSGFDVSVLEASPSVFDGSRAGSNAGLGQRERPDVYGAGASNIGPGAMGAPPLRAPVAPGIGMQAQVPGRPWPGGDSSNAPPFRPAPAPPGGGGPGMRPAGMPPGGPQMGSMGGMRPMVQQPPVGGQPVPGRLSVDGLGGAKPAGGVGGGMALGRTAPGGSLNGEVPVNFHKRSSTDPFGDLGALNWGRS